MAELEQWKGREVARLLALVESERRYYQDIVAAMPVGLLVVSHDFSILSANRAVRRILGLRSGDPVRGRLDSLLPVWVLDKVQSVFKGCDSVSNLMVEANDRRLRISVLPIRNGDEENLYEALVSIEDLTSVPAASSTPEPIDGHSPQPTPTSAAEPATTEAVELLQSLDAIIWAVDLPGMNFLFVTNTAEEVLGFHPDHWLNTPGFWAERMDPSDREAVLKSYQGAIERGARHSCEFRAQSADGRTVWMRETARVLVDAEGRPKHLIGLTIDITERRQLEDENVRAERMDAIRKLASRLSHDLNNKLMIVKGYSAELLNNAGASDALRADVHEIVTATEEIDALTSQLLAFTRLQPGPAVTIDLSEMLHNLEGKLRQNAGPDVEIEITNDRGLQAKGDRGQLEQLLSGLATRACVSAKQGCKLTIDIGEAQIDEDLRRAERVLAPGEYAVISVEDNGGLLTPSAQMALFESILPVKDLPGETGAILSHGYGYVRQWGGDISVTATLNGTRISILLPHAGRKEVVAAPAIEIAAPPAIEVQPVTAVAQAVFETILVVEDEPGIRALVRKILRRQGYTVLEAANRDEAAKICQEHTGKIDLLITDVVQPDAGGGELVNKLRERCEDIKLLYVSSHAGDAEFPAGTAFLQKPFTLGSLLDKVKEVLSQ